MTVALATVSLFITACDDDMSSIGSSISSSEVTINVDSLIYKLDATTIEAPDFESRSNFSLIGSINVPEYGALQCSYVTQFLPAEKLNIPDSIKAENIDSVKIIMTVAKNLITGDSLAPQQLKVYSLNKQLPADINSNFNPEGYYENTPLAIKNYTLSGYTYNDTTYKAETNVKLSAQLPVELGRKFFNDYQTNPDIFIWPQKFAEYWPGIYVAPTFGKGCIAPVTNTSVYVYFPKTKVVTEKDTAGNEILVDKIVPDSVCMFSSAPEVISNVNINYTPSQFVKNQIANGRNIITTPGGYTVRLKFPAKDILKDYWNEEYDLGVINNMIFKLPVKLISNSYGLGLPPALLMIKTSELDSFFAEGKLPDNKNSFYSVYSSTSNSYSFNSMREYIKGLREKGEAGITDEDVDFTLVPVAVTTEDYTDSKTGTLVTTVTSVVPYITKPTMVELDTDNSIIVFTYSNETLF